MVGGAALIEDDDFGAAVMGLSGCHQTRAAGAEDDDIGLHVPLGRDFLLNARRMSKRCGGRHVPPPLPQQLRRGRSGGKNSVRS